MLSAASMLKLKKVHPDLVRVVLRARTLIADPELGFIVTCGLRSIAEQRVLLAKGATRTMNSRHLPGRKTRLSHAFDLAVTIKGKVRWDWPLYQNMSELVKAAARIEKVPIEWGGDWRTFKDGPHYQLPVSKYPG